MGKAKHTPGPWVAVKDNGPGVVCWDVARPDPRDKGPNDPNRYLIADLGPERSDGTTPANARLIAAAPDLLAALVRLLDDGCPFVGDADSCECGENGDGTDRAGNPCEHRQAWAAIQKATGG